MRKQIVFALLLLCVGCGMRYSDQSLSVDHPAYSQAEIELPIAPSNTLDLASAEPVTLARSEVSATHNHRHDMHSSQESEGDSDAAASQGVVYVCPMHHEVTSDELDSHCPKCGMRLVRKEPNGGHP